MRLTISSAGIALIKRYEGYRSTVYLTQCQFDALVSFSFNLGLGVLQRSTLRQKLNRNDYDVASKEFLKYTRAGGKVLNGLVRRRQAEYNLFNRHSP